jgi:hypothetical protein
VVSVVWAIIAREKNILSKSLKLVNLILLRIPSTYAAVQRQLANIQMYPALRVEIRAVASELEVPCASNACLISAHAAMTELSTIRPKEKRAIEVTDPPNQSTSPYAIKMMVKFLKIVYTGIDRNRSALVLV